MMSHRDDLLRITLVLSAIYLGAALFRGLDHEGTALQAGLGAAPFAAALLAAWWTRHAPAEDRLATGWPILAWPLLYDGAVRVVSLAPERYVDASLGRIDEIVLHRATLMPGWALGGPLEELANVFYTSYYLVIPLAFAWMWRRRSPDVALAYGTAMLTALSSCAIIWLILPSGGYHLGGSPTSPSFGPFTAIARTIYAINPHYAAAFPSSHVALAFAAAGVLWYEGGGRLWMVWAAMVAWATIYGQYHYAVDTPPAVVIGLLSAAWAVRSELGVLKPAFAYRPRS